MPPKKGEKGKKKPSKRQLEAERRAEEERVAAAAEEARLLKEQKLREERERKEKAEEDAWIESEKIKMNQEVAAYQNISAARKNAIAKHDKIVAMQEEWKRFVYCSHLPDPKSEADLNTFLNVWDEEDVEDIDQAISLYQDTETVIDEIENMSFIYEEREDWPKLELMRDFLVRLRQLVNQKFDQSVAFILQHLEDYTTPKNECQMAFLTDDLKCGLWVNIAKNLRLKQVEYPDLGITTEIPRPIMLNFVSMRIRYHSRDPFRFLRTREYAVGGSLTIDVLAMPPPAKVIKGWKMAPVTAQTTQVLVQPYPPGDSAQYAGNIPPLRISWVIPDNCLVGNTFPMIGHFNEKDKQWRTDGVQDIEFKFPTRTLSFQTIHLNTTYAWIKTRHGEVPYTTWTLRPTGLNKSVLELQAQSTGRVVIEIGEGTCRLLEPAESVLAEFRSGLMRPVTFLRRLAQRGICLCPEDEDAEEAGVTVKNKELEGRACRNASLVAAGFSITSSRWNQSAGQDDCVFRMGEVLSYSDQPDPESADRWVHVGVKTTPLPMCVRLSCTEEDEAYHEDRLVNMQAKQLLLSLASTWSSPAAPLTCDGSSPQYTEAVRKVLEITRVFSFGAPNGFVPVPVQRPPDWELRDTPSKAEQQDQAEAPEGGESPQEPTATLEATVEGL
mmetsp:Transcript_14766/g.34602  ORF Transcript_14766/g.34602 Transcript_14766/m.34602 type:complete len:667 (-) Transcript_14766:48-2048(-)